MTSRLKHKLELENVNLNSAYLNESFVLIGTPLPALADSKKDKLEYVPEWQQEVRDEKGRRRFHGAFEGGWSAGYFNTVGSKEGWAPSTFKSSRNNRAKTSQRPEDFMDEEDLKQMNDDRQLENTETFRTDTFAGTREELASRDAATSLESLIAPARTSIGQKLLTKLGWRPGQGIGPRVTLRKLKVQQAKSGVIRSGSVDDDMDDAEASKHTFAPRDTKLLVYEGKEDREGLGYEKGRGMGPLPGHAGPSSRMPVDDDEDPYEAEGAGSSRHFAFDNGEEADDEVINIGGPSRNMSRPERNGRGEGYSDGIDRWHDGRPVLQGFALDPKGVPPDKWFKMPEIPPDWRPRPARVWGTTRRWDETPGTVKEEKEVIRGAPGKPLTFEQRGAALGEEPVSKAKSVFEYMSEKDRERLASIAATASAPPPAPLKMKEEPEEEVGPPAEEVIIPPLSPRTAGAALRGFIPYGDDLAKQDRYRSYLTSQTYNTKEPNPVLRKGTFDEINKELDDFAASARIFKPMSFAMSSRFTAGSASLATSDLKQAKPGLHIYDAEKMKAETEKPKPPEEIKKPLTPREQAAQSGMYGQMTRMVKDFFPVKLLCKRFGVADPHPGGQPAKINTGGNDALPGLDSMPVPKNDASWEDNFIHQTGESGSTPTAAIDLSEEPERRPRTIGEVGMADDVNQGRDTLNYTKPSIDIFKAIFASDDEDSDDEEEVPNPAQKSKAPVTVSTNDTNGSTSARLVDPFPVKEQGPVDLATFKPVFNVKKDDQEEAKSKEERKKEKKAKKKRKGVLSFDVGDDEGEVDAFREEKKKRKKERGNNPTQTKDGGEGDWVEKAEVKPLLVGRKGAADYM